MTWTVAINGGDIPVQTDEGSSRTVVILAHGAGSHMDQKTVVWLAGLLREVGAQVVRFNFLYRTLGRGVPDRMPVLMNTYRAVAESVRNRLNPERLILAGHSMGGRVASMIEAEGQTADGLLLFGYPLHPPNQPEKLRVVHLAAIRTPTLQLNGTEDPLCTRELMDQAVATLDPSIWRLHWIEHADHSYGVRKASGRTQADVGREIVSVLESSGSLGTR